MFLTSRASSFDLVIAILLLIFEYAMMLLTTGIFLSIKRISSIQNYAMRIYLRGSLRISMRRSDASLATFTSESLTMLLHI